ncbi:MAG: DUF4382 domain-containing protein [Nanoarchaeota archaeon]
MKVINLFVMLIALLLIVGCTGQEPTEPQETTEDIEDETTDDEEVTEGTSSLSGNFNLLVSDAPADIEDFESVEVTLSKTKIFGGNDSEEGFEEKEIDATVDLTEVVGNDSEEVLTTELEAGEYDKIELYVESVDATTTEGEEAEVMVPSEKLQITKPFEVIEGEVTNFVFDINVVKKGQGNDYNLLPVISESGVADETGKLQREEAQGEEAQQAVENVTESAAGNDSEVAGEEAEEAEE